MTWVSLITTMNPLPLMVQCARTSEDSVAAILYTYARDTRTPSWRRSRKI
jgi:hypothetical protein